MLNMKLNMKRVIKLNIKRIIKHNEKLERRNLLSLLAYYEA